MRLSLYEFHTGAETFGPHRVVYDVTNDVAFFGEAHVEGHALVWQLDDTPDEAEGALVSRRIQLDPFAEWVVRCCEAGNDPGDQRLHLGVPAELLGVLLAVRHHHPAEVAGLAQGADGHDRLCVHLSPRY